MSVVNVLSTQITNDEATPPVRNNPYIAGGNDVELVDVCTAGASDSANSTYRFFRIPSNARIVDVQIMNDANTTGTSYKAGFLKTDANGGGVVTTGSDACLIPAGTSMASARDVWTSLYFPAVAGSAAAVANVTKRVWELVGLTADPNDTYDVAITAVTPGTAGGNMAMRLAYVR